MSEIIWYPTNQVMGILADEDAVDAVLGDLRGLGKEDAEIMILTGEEGASRIDVTGKRHNLLVRVVRALQFASMDAMDEARVYQDAAQDGQFVIGVPAENTDDQHAIAGVIRQHGGEFIHFYGRLESRAL